MVHTSIALMLALSIALSLAAAARVQAISPADAAHLGKQLSKHVHFGKQPVSFRGGLRNRADSPDAGPEGWGARFAVTFLFPK